MKKIETSFYFDKVYLNKITTKSVVDKMNKSFEVTTKEEAYCIMERTDELRHVLIDLTTQSIMLNKKIGIEYGYDKVLIEAVKEETEKKLSQCRKELSILHHFLVPQSKKILGL